MPTTTGGFRPAGRSSPTDPTDDAATELAQARQHFFLPRRYRDPFGHDTVVDFDANDLLMVETRDALGNRVDGRRPTTTACCSRASSATRTATRPRSPSTRSAWWSAPR